MARRGSARRVTTLWQLTWNEDRISCCVYHAKKGLELRLETLTHTLLAEPFELGPRMLSRTHALKRSLKRRGWQEPRA